MKLDPDQRAVNPRAYGEQKEVDENSRDLDG